jgi:hypothetical protein
MENASRARLFAALAMCFLAATALSSCRLWKGGSLSAPGIQAEPTGTGLAVSARFVTADDDVSGFFKKLMPDSGIIPVRMAIRNAGDLPILIHSANGMRIGTGFEGFALSAGGTRCLPLHPKEVVARLVGEKKAGRYRRHGAYSFIGGTLIPPVAAYLVYNEIEIGRFYRPLFSKSLYRALEDGMFEPVRLEPGQERSGYLYFAIPSGTPRDSCEILVRGAGLAGTIYSISGGDFMLSRDELPFTDSSFAVPADSTEHRLLTGSCDSPYGYLFSLADDSSPSRKGLYFSRIRALDPESDSLWTRMASISSKNASIIDATCIGSLAACAVNFKSKARVYFLQCGETPDVYAERHFSRGVRRVFLHTGGAYVVTDNGVCHSYNGPSQTWRHGVKLGVDVDEAGLYRGRIFAFLKKKELRVYGGESESGTLSLLERHPLRERVTSAIGLVGAKLVFLSRGDKTHGDALSLFDIDARSQMPSWALPGTAVAVASDGSNLVVQLAGGTLVRMRPEADGTFDVTEAGYLPFDARALKAAPHGFIAIGGSGDLAAGEIGSFSPGAAGTVEVSVRVR